MADLQLNFGLKTAGEGGTGITSTSAHWFTDGYWTTDGDATTKQRPVIQVRNPNSYPVYLKTLNFSLINGSSGGTSFPTSSGNNISTTASTATMVAYIGTNASGAVSVGQGQSVFVYDSRAGYSYWKYRPSNASGSLYPDSDNHNLIDFYKFSWSNPTQIPANGTIIIWFTASFNTSGTHLIQIYPTGAISAPVTHKVTFDFNGGTESGKGSYVEYVNHGSAVSRVPSPTRTDYSFSSWSPNDKNYQNVTADLTYTANWTINTANYAFYRNHSNADTDVLKSGTANIGSSVSNLKPSDPTWSGYTFKWWSTTRAGNAISSDAKITSGDNNFYARWGAITGSVDFYRNYSSTDNEHTTVTGVEYVKKTLADVKPSDLVRDGYKFQGWSLSRSGSVAADTTKLWDTSNNQAITKFYAIWKQTATVWIRENGVWVKKLMVRKFNGNTWTTQPPKERQGGSWKDKS